MITPDPGNHLPLTSEKATVGVLGGGAWGTALAIHAARAGHAVLQWARDGATVEAMNKDRENPVYLPGIRLPPNLKATTDMRAVFDFCEMILMVIPCQYAGEALQQAAEWIRPGHIIVSCSKGIVNTTLETLDEVFERILPPHTQLAYLSGPSFAKEVALDKPTCVTIASKSPETAARVQLLLSTPIFRCYRTTDVAGVEMGGAMKNVLAIACGISDGLEYGANARAALITRGLLEIARMAAARGANPLTMSGLAGMGDLVLTCTGDLSRNRTLGMRIGKGEKLRDILASTKSVVEGVVTSASAHKLAEKLGLDCPVVRGIYKVLHEDKDPRQMVLETMSRALKPEIEDDITMAAAVSVGGSGHE
ncbi:unnamed protein product [Pedinophyceae sp. YPF-701]|nr:unnamed protein product [Pedinophyceae sp. YPF-701]